MIITVKNLQQQTFTVNFQAEKKVIELKQKIFQERGPDYVVEKQKLIYAGVILDDDRSIASYNVDEKKFVVVMLKRDIGVPQKPDDTPASSTNTDTAAVREETKDTKPSTENSGLNKNESKNDTAQKDDRSAADKTQQAVGSSADVSPPSAANIAEQNVELVNQRPGSLSDLLMGEEYLHTVTMITEMGYCRDMVERAMAASFNNPERAVEYLISGIPNEDGLNLGGLCGAAEAIPRIVEGVARTRAGEQSSDRDTTAERTSEDPFEFLRNQPQFLQMRSLVYQNPDLLHAVLQQIGQTNPALLQLISDNQDAFLSMLNQPIDGGNNANNSRQTTAGRQTQTAAAGTDGARIRSLDLPLGGGIDAATRNQSQGEVRNEPRIAASGEEGGQGRDNIVSMRGVGGGGGGGGGNAADGPAIATIRLTPQDQIAIERLKALGFPEALVLQAYFACEKDEQLAANFLISSAFDD